MSGRTVSIEGFASRVGGADPRMSLPELIFEVVSQALCNAGCTMGQVDGVVIAAHDLIDGRSLSSMITGPAAGAYLRDEIRVSDDALVAVSLAAARLQAGEGSKVVVASWGRASEGDPDRTATAGLDPFTEKPVLPSRAVISALRASAYLRTHSSVGRQAARTARESRAQANPWAVPAPRGALVYPLLAGEGSVDADVVAAVVLGRDPSPVTITGIGHGTERARLVDRSMTELPGATAAVSRASSAARRAASTVDAVEVAGASLFEELMLLEAAGVAAPGSGLMHFAETPWINASGGSLAGDCYPCSGLLRLTDAARALGRSGGPRSALVAASSAVAMQTTTAIILEAT